MSSLRDISDVVAHLSRQRLPFAWYVMWPDGRSIEVEVAPRGCVVAIEYCADHSLNLADETPVPVHGESRRGESWVSPPAERARGRDDEFGFAQLVGLDVDEAATPASAAGWIVRAHEHQAVLTADFNPGRLNLRYGNERVVDSVDRG